LQPFINASSFFLLIHKNNHKKSTFN
jgi:hypothetical protein